MSADNFTDAFTSPPAVYRAKRRPRRKAIGHDFLPVAGHPDDDECTHRSDGTDATYCGEPRRAHTDIGRK